MFGGLFFKVRNPLYLGGGHNFLISNPFSIIVNVSRGGVQGFFGQQKQQSPSLESGLP
jgi:hypothetical protein